MTKHDTETLKAKLEEKNISGNSSTHIVFKSAELNDIDASGSIVEYVIFDKLSAAFLILNKAKLKHVEFRDCTLFKLYLKESDIENVSFKNCQIKSLNIQGANLSSLSFKNSKIDSVSFLLSDGHVDIENSKLSNLKLNKSSINWKINNTSLENIQAYQIQGRMTLTNSTLKNANFEFGKMDSIDITGSTVTEINGPGAINEHLTIKDSKIEWVNVLAATRVSIANSKIERFGFTRSQIDQFTIRDSDYVAGLGFAMATVKKMVITNSNIGDLSLLRASIDNIEMKNVQTGERKGVEAFEAKIGEWKAENVTLHGELSFEHTHLGNKSFTNVKIASDAQLNMSEANFTFQDGN